MNRVVRVLTIREGRSLRLWPTPPRFSRAAGRVTRTDARDESRRRLDRHVNHISSTGKSPRGG